jgi:hypothetical protein
MASIASFVYLWAHPGGGHAEEAAMRSAHDTGACPRGRRCESCGAETGDVDVEIVEIAHLGLACLSLCRPCARSSSPPNISVITALRIIADHARHVGAITGDTVTAPVSRREG